MGCDIHASIDYEEYEDLVFEFARLHLSRSYTLFAYLADVRNHYIPRIEPISQPRGVHPNASTGFLEELRIWNGDAHSISWVTLAELETIASHLKSVELQAVIGLMQPLEKAGMKPRLLFFFDN